MHDTTEVIFGQPSYLPGSEIGLRKISRGNLGNRERPAVQGGFLFPQHFDSGKRPGAVLALNQLPQHHERYRRLMLRWQLSPSAENLVFEI